MRLTRCQGRRVLLLHRSVRLSCAAQRRGGALRLKKRAQYRGPRQENRGAAGRCRAGSLTRRHLSPNQAGITFARGVCGPFGGFAAGSHRAQQKRFPRPVVDGARHPAGRTAHRKGPGQRIRVAYTNDGRR